MLVTSTTESDLGEQQAVPGLATVFPRAAAMAAENPQGSEARKLEKLAGLNGLRTKLECKLRGELQIIAKMHGVAANLKSGVDYRWNPRGSRENFTVGQAI